MSMAWFSGWPVLCTQLAAMLCAHNEHLEDGRSLRDANVSKCERGKAAGGGKPSGTL